ncbi:TetR/AcrR family transcriptional regulator [Paracoccus aestuariivivens]|uniref:TetR family transcriptional regulator n=1 Tax=Paracoccus aestuariivivens TaxID=1820333 RepID=A0A6L6J3W5_9RHOB|nr:TetR/AcrR family transcriptional regulator [Paracoccus aestuariivivens]MTH76813.1 TetR family transcriptional regulator [Paracoccus aestuariivivens]
MTEIAETATPTDDSPKRQQILDGARRMFLTKGFEAASMQDVAKSAGVSKGTLYVYFDSKETMFEALVLCECGRMQEIMRQIGSGGGSVEEQLREIARQMVNRLLQSEVLSAMRMVIGTGEKFPDLARKVYEAGPMRSAHTLAGYLAQRVERGDLRIEDCGAASAEFIDLVISGQQRRALLMMPPMSSEDLERYIDRRVALFLTAYAA